MVQLPDRTAFALPPRPNAAPLVPAPLPAVHSDPSALIQTPPAPRSPAPVHLVAPGNWCAALHAVAQSPSAFAPALPHSTFPSTAVLRGNCRRDFLVRVDLRTTAAVAQTRV